MMKTLGRNLVLRIMAAWMTFTIGVLIHVALSFQINLTGNANQLIAPVAPLRADELHGLYEAARVTGDRRLVDRFMCMKADGSIDAVEIYSEEMLAFMCLNPDGSKYIWDWRVHDEFVQRHRRWSLNNIEFLRSISTREKAEEYIRTHRPYFVRPTKTS